MFQRDDQGLIVRRLDADLRRVLELALGVFGGVGDIEQDVGVLRSGLGIEQPFP